MDSRAKQRITGAVILVAVFVLLVPELLTGPATGAANAPAATPTTRACAATRSISTRPRARPRSPRNAAPPPAVELPSPWPRPRSRCPAKRRRPESAPPQAAPPSRRSSAARRRAHAAVRAPVADDAAPRVRGPTPAPRRRRRPRPPAAAARGTRRLRRPARQLQQPRQCEPPGSRHDGQGIRGLRRADHEQRTASCTAYASVPRATGPPAEALATQLRRIGQTGSIVSIS